MRCAHNKIVHCLLKVRWNRTYTHRGRKSSKGQKKEKRVLLVIHLTSTGNPSGQPGVLRLILDYGVCVLVAEGSENKRAFFTQG